MLLRRVWPRPPVGGATTGHAHPLVRRDGQSTRGSTPGRWRAACQRCDSSLPPLAASSRKNGRRQHQHRRRRQSRVGRRDVKRDTGHALRDGCQRHALHGDKKEVPVVGAAAGDWCAGPRLSADGRTQTDCSTSHCARRLGDQVVMWCRGTAGACCVVCAVATVCWLCCDTLSMEDECTMRPCATDFSIAAIMARHGRARCRDPPPDTSLSPLGTSHKNH